MDYNNITHLETINCPVAPVALEGEIVLRVGGLAPGYTIQINDRINANLQILLSKKKFMRSTDNWSDERKNRARCLFLESTESVSDPHSQEKENPY